MPGGFGKIQEYNSSLTQEQRKEAASRAGKASAAATRHKRTLQEWAILLRDLPSTNAEFVQEMTAAGLRPEEITAGAEMVAAVQRKATRKGDERALSVLRDTAGEVPVQRVAVSGLEELRQLSEAELRQAAESLE